MQGPMKTDVLKNKMWKKRGRWHHSIACGEIYGDGESTEYSRKIGLPFKRTGGLWLSNGDYFDLEEDWAALRRTIEKEYRADPDYLHNYADRCLSIGEDILNFSKKVQNKDMSGLTNKELAKLYLNLISKLKGFMPFMFSLHLVDEFLTERFLGLLKEFTDKKGIGDKGFLDYQMILSLPCRKIFVLQEKEDLMKIAITVKERKLSLNDKLVISMLQKHKNKYAWINSILIEKEPYDTVYYRERLNKMVRSYIREVYQSIKENEANLRFKQKKYLKEIRSNRELYNITITTQLFGFLRSFRVDAPNKTYGDSWNLIEEIAKRVGIPPLETRYLDSKEISRALAGDKINHKGIIRERKQGSSTVMINSERYVITDRDFTQKMLEHTKSGEEESVDLIKGAIAYPGKITGFCKVLYSLDDMKKVEKGDIIVISMTDPHYIPVMEKASAFVTDFGGILCHAAIVAREMKKPCVIGTKRATKIFKDGDLLEVDAEKGLVRKVD